MTASLRLNRCKFGSSLSESCQNPHETLAEQHCRLHQFKPAHQAFISGGQRRFNAVTQRAGSAFGLVALVHPKPKTLRVQAFHKAAREAKAKRTPKAAKACVTDKQAEHQEEQENYAVPEPLTVLVKEGRRPDELRAAAVLRSNSFNVYPPGRSEAAAKVRCRLLPSVFRKFNPGS